MMKICMVTTTYPAYAGHPKGNFVHALASELARKDHVTVVAPYYKASRVQRETTDKVRIERYAYFWPRRLQRLLEEGTMYANFRTLLGFVQVPLTLVAMTYRGWKASREAEVVHGQWALAGMACIIIKKLTGKPLVVTFRGSDLNHRENLVLRWMVDCIIKNADALTTNNKRQYAILQTLTKKEVLLIYNGVDTRLFKYRAQRVARKQLGLSATQRVILYVGWLDPHKGIRYLVEAAQDPAVRDYLFLFVGTGSLLEELRTLQKTQKNIRIVGEIAHEKLPLYMNAADVLILPSLGEGMPNVVLEALASGTPVISTDVGDVAEFVRDEKNGFLIKPRSTEAIVDALKKVFAKGTLEKLQKHVKRFAQRNDRSWEQCAARYEKIYRRVRPGYPNGSWPPNA